jgi:hypothetical protein
MLAFFGGPLGRGAELGARTAWPQITTVSTLRAYRIRAIIRAGGQNMLMKFGGVLFLAASAVLPSAALADDKVTVDQVPAPIRATIERETRGGRVHEIERETKRGVRVYEVEFIRDNKKYEMHVGEDGTVLKHKLD